MVRQDTPAQGGLEVDVVRTFKPYSKRCFGGQGTTFRRSGGDSGRCGGLGWKLRSVGLGYSRDGRGRSVLAARPSTPPSPPTAPATATATCTAFGAATCEASGVLYITTTPPRARTSLDTTVEAVADHCGIGSNLGKKILSKTRVMGARSVMKSGEVTCVPISAASSFWAPLPGQTRRLEDEEQLLRQLPKLPGLQCSWLLLLLRASPRANHALRTVPPQEILAFARADDRAVWHTLKQCIGGADEPEAPHAHFGGLDCNRRSTRAPQHTGPACKMLCR